MVSGRASTIASLRRILEMKTRWPTGSASIAATVRFRSRSFVTRYARTANRWSAEITPGSASAPPTTWACSLRLSSFRSMRISQGPTFGRNHTMNAVPTR